MQAMDGWVEKGAPLKRADLAQDTTTRNVEVARCDSLNVLAVCCTPCLLTKLSLFQFLYLYRLSVPSPPLSISHALSQSFSPCVCLSDSPPFCLFRCVFVCLSDSLSLCVCLSIFLSLCQTQYFSLHSHLGVYNGGKEPVEEDQRIRRLQDDLIKLLRRGMRQFTQHLNSRKALRVAVCGIEAE